MIIELLSQVTPGEAATIAAGFFFTMWIVALRNGKPKPRRYYETKIPSTLVIEQEA